MGTCCALGGAFSRWSCMPQGLNLLRAISTLHDQLRRGRKGVLRVHLSNGAPAAFAPRACSAPNPPWGGLAVLRGRGGLCQLLPSRGSQLLNDEIAMPCWFLTQCLVMKVSISPGATVWKGTALPGCNWVEVSVGQQAFTCQVARDAENEQN